MCQFAHYQDKFCTEMAFLGLPVGWQPPPLLLSALKTTFEMSITGDAHPTAHGARWSSPANMILELGKKAEEKGQNDNSCKVASWELLGLWGQYS